MIVLATAALVYLEVPKTATMAVRAMLGPLKPRGGWPMMEAGRHLGGHGFNGKWRHKVETMVGRPVETFCVVREPLARAESWYRYLQRDKVKDGDRSSRGLSFAEFLALTLDAKPPPVGRIGTQDRFCGFDGNDAVIDHIFDYKQMTLLTAFLAEGTGADLRLPRRNASPSDAPRDVARDLPDELLQRYRAARANELALYAKVTCAGHWRTSG